LSFAERIYRMSGNKHILIFLVFMTVVRFIGSIANFAVFWTSESIIDYTERYSWFIPTLLGMGVVTDLVIAVTLVYYFRQQRLRIFKRCVVLVPNHPSLIQGPWNLALSRSLILLHYGQ